MTIYDAIIVGSGPAGGQCARDLSRENKKVLLLEKSKSFHTNNYSSGGAPLSMMKQFMLPESILGTYWNTLMIATSNDAHAWSDAHPSGVVCDFRKLREFLADEAQKHYAELRLHSAYLSHENQEGSTLVEIQNLDTHEKEVVKTKVLVDATGVERKVLMGGGFEKKGAVAATGIEYLIESSPEDYRKYGKALNFYFGHRWMPQGYAWIFPMEENRLKVGIIRYFPQEKIVPYENSYPFYLDKFVNETLSAPPKQILDRHGKTLYYMKGQKDIRFEGNVIAIGDAISTLNPMACEGIRHALVSGKTAAKYILEYLDGEKFAFAGYEKEMDRYFGLKWFFSEVMMNRIYKQKEDIRFDQMLETFKSFTMKEMLDFSFDYKFSKMFKLLTKYGLNLFRQAVRL